MKAATRKKKTESPIWRGAGDLICLDLVTDGTTGPDWIRRLGRKKYRLSEYVKSVLRSPAFVPTTDRNIGIIIFPGTHSRLRGESTLQLWSEATTTFQCGTPTMEAACLMREVLTNDDFATFGIRYIVMMHKAALDVTKQYRRLAIGSHDSGRRLYAAKATDEAKRRADGGYAFERLSDRSGHERQFLL